MGGGRSRSPGRLSPESGRRRRRQQRERRRLLALSPYLPPFFPPGPGRSARQVSGRQVSAPTCARSARPAAPAAPGLPAALRAGAPRRRDLSCAPSPSPLSLASGVAPRAGWASPSQALLLQPLALGYFGLGVQRAPELGEPGRLAGHLPAALGAESTGLLKGPGIQGV